MTRGRSTTPRPSSSFAFPIQLPVLHPPRLLKRQPSAPLKIDQPLTSDIMAPTRNRRRRSTITLPDVENLDVAPQLRSKRKNMVTPLPLSPRTLNLELTGRSLASSEKVSAVHKWNKGGYQSFIVPSSDSNSENMPLDSKLTMSAIEPPPTDKIFCSPRSATLELSFDDELPISSTQNSNASELGSQGDRGLIYLEPYGVETEFEDLTTQLEELTVRGARSRAQQRERAARRWEGLCSARIRFLKEQAAQSMIFAEMAAAATRPPIDNPTFFNVFGTSPQSGPAPHSPFASHGAPMTQPSSPSPYTSCGETLDLAAIASSTGREELEAICGPDSIDPRPLVDRMIEYLDDFEYDEINVDGLTEAECRQLRIESRKRRRLDRQRAFELSMLLELKRRQMGRSRSSSSSSDSSTSSTSSDSDCEQPLSPISTPCGVKNVDQLVAKMFLKRKEMGQRQCTNSAAARKVFEARGCSSLRIAMCPALEAKVKVGRKRSHSTKAVLSDFFSLSGGAFGLGGTAWLKEKRRLTSMDQD